MATILVPVAAGFGRGASFDFLHEPGGHWRWRRRAAKPNGAPHWNQLLTPMHGVERGLAKTPENGEKKIKQQIPSCERGGRVWHRTKSRPRPHTGNSGIPSRST